MDKPPPKWIDCRLPEEFDIAVLRPPELSKSERFETERDVDRRAVEHIIPGLLDHMPTTANKIADCAEGKENCLLPICPICSRQYRRTLIGDLLQKIYPLSPNGAQTATVYLERYDTGTLSNASLGTVHAGFRKKIERSGFGGAIIIGGTEVTYRPEPNDWLLHLHLLSIGASEQAWEGLENRPSNYGIRDPLRVKPVQAQDYIDQLSYLQKFHTYYRAGTPKGDKRGRAYPLKEPQLRELASWACKYKFSDFTFCFGAQKRHGRLWVRDELKKAFNRAYVPTRLRAPAPPPIVQH
jgi:hypothetical protein